jgi:hypothetical protein
VSDEDSIEGKQPYELSPAQAREVLAAFLMVERKAFDDLRASGETGICFDFSQDSVLAYFTYVLPKVVQAKERGHLANNQLRTDVNVWVARLAFYLGEALTRTSPCLRWDIGEADTALENHPVISGFPSGVEAPVITVAENVLLSYVLDGQMHRIGDAVEGWFKMAVDH